MKKISYYDLLGMIKEENIPDKIYLHNLNKKVAYIKDVDVVSNEFNGYMLDDPNKDQNENFKYWLGECFLESDMFKECIEIKETFEEMMLNAQKVIVDAFSRLKEPLKKIMEIEGLNLKEAEEDEEIEFEDIESFGIHYSWDYIDYKNIEELKKYTNKDFQKIFDTLDKLIKNQKKLIDAVNKLNKGE